MSTNDIWQLTVSGLVQGQQHIHTLHFKELTPAADGTPLLTAWAAAPRTAYRALFATQHQPVQLIRAQKVCGSVPLPSPDETNYDAATSAGTRAALDEQFLPSFLACHVTEKGVLAGRRYSGRFFLGGMHEIDCANNQFQTAYLTLVTAYINALKTAFVTPATPAYRLFCYSHLLGHGDANRQIKNPSGPGYVTSPVAAVPNCQDAGSDVRDLILSIRPTTMRSRKLGHGI